jgi:hypothetical protein
MDWRNNKNEKPEEYRELLLINNNGHVNVGIFINGENPHYRIRGDWDDLLCKDENIKYWQYIELPE